MKANFNIRLAQSSAFATTLISFYILATKPDFERYLIENAPGNPMTDAFNGLNKMIPVFMILLAGTVIVFAIIYQTRKYIFMIPLLFGPMICFVGWYVTENFEDPSWFHMVAITAVGMLVSCPITTILLIADKLQQYNSMDRRPP